MENIDRLVDMGFTHEQSVKALQMNHNDVEKAISYLFDDQAEPQSNAPDYYNGDSNHLENKISETSIGDSYSDQNQSSMSLSKSQDEKESHVTFNPSLGDKNMELDSSESEEFEFPPLENRSSEEPLVVLNKQFNKYENWVVPLILALIQIDGFKSRFDKPSDNDFLQSIHDLIQKYDGFDGNYCVNDFQVNFDDIDVVEELIPKIYEFISTNYEQEFEDKYVENAIKSKVESIDDESEQDIVILEVDTDNRYSNTHDSLNELFWGHNLENFNNLNFNRVGDIFTVYYMGDNSFSYNSRIDLQDIIYPELYSHDMLPKLNECLVKFNELNERKVKLTNELMKLLIFEGKKITPFLQQSLNHIQDEKAKAELSNLDSKLRDSKQNINDEIKSIIKQIDENSIKNYKNFLPLLTPYKLISLIINDCDYYYWNKQLKKWIHVKIFNDLNFDQRVLDFDQVHDEISERTSSRCLPFSLIYCKNDVIQGDSTSHSIDSEMSDKKLVDLE